MNKRIWLSSPHMGGKELQYIETAFDTNWIAPLGPNVDGFEHDIESYLGNNTHVAALNSGTGALHLALIILGVGYGDEVICQSMTFSASANPIVYLGATPVFVDSEAQTWNMSPAYLEESIKDRLLKGKKPKAIIVVHLYGMPAAMEAIIEIAGKYEIPVIEDAAEALGSTYKGRKLGTLGDINILSFNGNKIITTSGGGALISKNNEWIVKARFLATQARDNAVHYEHSQIGYNYRLSNVCAGIGRGQMEVLPQRILQRRANFDTYKDLLKSIYEIKFIDEPTVDYYSNRWLTAILIKEGIDKETIRKTLEGDDIETRYLWKPMHLQPIFKGCPFYGDGTSESLFNRGLCLPSGSNLTQDDIHYVVKKIKHCFTAVPA